MIYIILIIKILAKRNLAVKRPVIKSNKNYLENLTILKWLLFFRNVFVLSNSFGI